MLLLLATRPFSFEADAPKAVEITRFRQADRDILNLLNFQRELPNIPVEGLRLRLRLDGRHPRTVVVVADKTPVPYVVDGDTLVVIVPRLDAFLMVAVNYAQ